MCGIFGHVSNVCPSREAFLEYLQEQANMMNSYNQKSKFDPFSNTYNTGWRFHPNLSWNNNQNQNQASSSFQQRKPSLEDSLNNFIQVCQNSQQSNEQKFQQQEASLRKLEVQVGQIAEAMRSHVLGKFPSQSEQAKAITILQSGKVINTELNSKSHCVAQ